MTILHNFLRGVAWSTGMRWSIQLIGLISTVILARLLTPKDFGIIGMAMIALGLSASLTELGVSQHLIRTPKATRAHCNTAWSMSVLQNLLVAVLLAASAKLVAGYLGEPGVEHVMYVIALATAITGFSNIGPVMAQKELRFHKDFQFNVYKKLVAFVVTIGLALWFRNYWALAWAFMVNALLELGLSYLMFSYRPRWSLERFPEYFRFSLRIIPLTMAKYLNAKVDALVIGGLAGGTQLGLYNTSSELSAMATREVGASIGRGLFPNYAAIRHDPEQLNASFRNVLSSISLLVLPLGAGLSVCAPDIIPLLLGDKWLAAIPIVQWLAIAATLTSLAHLMTMQILIVSGHETASVIMVWLRLGLRIAAIALAVMLGGAAAIAAGVTMAAAISVPIAVMVLRHCLALPIAAILGALWRPLIATLVMTAFLIATDPMMPDVTSARLAIKVASGALIYGVTVLILWWFSGRPGGVEKFIVGTLRGRADKYAG